MLRLMEAGGAVLGLCGGNVGAVMRLVRVLWTLMGADGSWVKAGGGSVEAR